MVKNKTNVIAMSMMGAAVGAAGSAIAISLTHKNNRKLVAKKVVMLKSQGQEMVNGVIAKTKNLRKSTQKTVKDTKNTLSQQHA